VYDKIVTDVRFTLTSILKWDSYDDDYDDDDDDDDDVDDGNDDNDDNDDDNGDGKTGSVLHSDLNPQMGL